MNIKHIRDLQLNAVQQAMQDLYVASRKHVESMRRGQVAETWSDLRSFFTITVQAPARGGSTTWLHHLAAKHLHEYPGTTVIYVGQPNDCHAVMGPRFHPFNDIERASFFLKHDARYKPSLVLVDGNIMPEQYRWLLANMHDPESDLPQYVVRVVY